MANDTPSHLGKLLLGVLFALIGIGLLGIALNLTLDRRDFLTHAQTADGSVSHLNAGGSHPEIAFTTGTGENISYPQGGLIFGYQQGQSVRVHYLPEQPAGTAVVDDAGALWGPSGLLGCLGLLFTFAGLAKAIRHRGHGAVHSHKGL
ncbi:MULTISPECIES: DUF3592 domain-containing protein [Pseudomonas]|uniref:DUF3592 domain-containing protein n=1 Tax=Pseudomonas TaxID=286 RepID=UPI0005190133|nr:MULTISPECIES: DUF3592 domain-containing protein [Pseudomonas]